MVWVSQTITEIHSLGPVVTEAAEPMVPHERSDPNLFLPGPSSHRPMTNQGTEGETIPHEDVIQPRELPFHLPSMRLSLIPPWGLMLSLSPSLSLPCSLLWSHPLGLSLSPRLSLRSTWGRACAPAEARPMIVDEPFVMRRREGV